MQDLSRYIENKVNQVWCLTCGMNSFIKSGYTKQGKQRVKCKYCNIKTTVGALKKGERIFNPDKLLSILQKESQNLTDAELYCLGLLVADGCLKNHNTIALSMSYKDVDVVELFKKELNIPGKVKKYVRERKKDNGEIYIEETAEVSWQYKYSEPYWNALGIFSNKTGEEFWMSHMSSPHFVRGYLDGDGCFYFNGKEGRLSFTCLSKQFLIDLSKYLNNELDISIPNIYKIDRKRTETFGLKYRKKDATKIGIFLYNDSDNLYMKRKYDKFVQIKDSIQVTEGEFYQLRIVKDSKESWLHRTGGKYLIVSQNQSDCYKWKTLKGITETINRNIPVTWLSKYQINEQSYKEFYEGLGYILEIVLV